MSKTMLINSIEGHECRIAVLDDNRLDELYTERASSVNAVGSIYKGKVINIEPSIQAAFVEFGGAKNGFLHISDLHPKYFPKSKTKDEAVASRRLPLESFGYSSMNLCPLLDLFNLFYLSSFWSTWP